MPKPAAPKDDAPTEQELAPGWRGAEPVLCIAGKGPLDEAATAMLAQLLGKHGLGARVAPYDAQASGDARPGTASRAVMPARPIRSASSQSSSSNLDQINSDGQRLRG